MTCATPVNEVTVNNLSIDLRIHLVTLPRMDRFLLNCFNLQRFQLLIEDLT